MKCIWYQSETILNPMQQKNNTKIGSQLAKKSGNIDTKKKKKQKKIRRIENLLLFEVG